MSINPLDTIKEENNLLKLFDRIKGESRYVDFFNCILENEKIFKQDIYKNSDNYIKRIFNYNKTDIIITELNKILKPMKLKCTVDELSGKEVNEKFKSNRTLMVEQLKIEPAFICRVCEPSKIFETEDKLKTHREESGHKSNKISRIIPNKDKRLTIIQKNNHIYTPQLELIEYSGILAELNDKFKSINLKCSVERFSCRGEKVALLRFEPTLACYYCTKIYDTENELKECEKKCRRKKNEKIDDVGISEEEAIKRQKKRDEINKGLDKTK